MQSFHHSRGRVLFEVFCAFAIAESCVGAWKQTGAWALLSAAFVAALYGLVHAFDMVGRKSTVATVDTVPVAHQAAVAAPAPNEQLMADNGIEIMAEAKKAPPRPPRARKGKSAPKSSRRRVGAREEKAVEPPRNEVQVDEVALAEEPKLVQVAPRDEPRVAEATPPDETNVTPLPPPDETPPVPLTPLFEPKPFVRLQRGGFGRKAG